MKLLHIGVAVARGLVTPVAGLLEIVDWLACRNAMKTEAAMTWRGKAATKGAQLTCANFYTGFQLGAKQPSNRRSGKVRRDLSANLEEVVAMPLVQPEPQPLRG